MDLAAMDVRLSNRRARVSDAVQNLHPDLSADLAANSSRRPGNLALREFPPTGHRALFLCHSERSEEPRIFLGAKPFAFA